MKRIVFALGIVDILIGVVLALMCIADNLLVALLILAVAILLSIPFSLWHRLWSRSRNCARSFGSFTGG